MSILRRFSSLWSALTSIRIKYKLFITFMALILITVCSVSIVIYNKTTEVLERRVTTSTQQAFEQANAFIGYKLNNAIDVSSMLFMDRELNEIVNKGGPDYSLSEQLDDYHTLLGIFRSARMSNDIYSIRLYVQPKSIYAKEGYTISSISEIVDEAWFGEMMNNEHGIYCRPAYKHDYMDDRGEQHIISCVRPLLSEGYTGDILGVLSVDLQEQQIRNIIKQTGITQEGQVYLIDRNDSIISGINTAEIGSRMSEVDPKSHIVIRKEVEGTSWQLIALIPQQEIMAESRQWTKELLVLLAVVTTFAILLAAAIAEGITRRIRLLLQQIKKIELENWDARIPITSHDEIGMLQSHVNKMSFNMRKLIDEKYKAEAEKKTVELKALQAQINPHFLYNTLDLIHWMGMKHRAPEISEVAGQLATFFRISLSNGQDVISIRDEIEHVRTYLEIQNRRFSGRIHYTVDMNAELAECKTVKLVLQPIVENAILHGIQEKKEKRGSIRISYASAGDRIALVVDDDGTGMSPAQLARLNAGEGAGYGIRNVQNKLTLYYDGAASIRFESSKGSGTRVMIVIPYIQDESATKANKDNKGNH